MSDKERELVVVVTSANHIEGVSSAIGIEHGYYLWHDFLDVIYYVPEEDVDRVGGILDKMVAAGQIVSYELTLKGNEDE